jgi:3-oxoacyl-[acyl-carrier protein] reductase
MPQQLDGKVVVITGAGRGIGKGIAIGFAEQGAKVVCSARTQSQLDETVQTIKQVGGEAIAVQCDVASAESVQNLYTETMSAYGPVDVVIANAGGNFSRASVEDSDSGDWLTTIQVNLMGVYYTAKYAIPHMKVNGGHIILMGSGLGHRVGDSTHSAYSASKAGAWMLVRSLAKELQDYKICVNELIPGVVKTDILSGDARPDDSPLNIEWVKTPADVVPMALFIATQPLLGPTGQSFSLMRRDSQ